MAPHPTPTPTPAFILFTGLLSLLLLLRPTTTAAAAFHRPSPKPANLLPLANFHEAPAFRNGQTCPPSPSGGTTNGAAAAATVYDNTTIHIAMTLDANYLRGTMAAVLSILQHSTCPENVFFHFLYMTNIPEVFSTIKSTFPYLKFQTYHFETRKVRGLISKSIRQALDQPLNYARIYLANILPNDVKRLVYLDSDLVIVDDITKLWKVDLKEKVLAAPEYCHANITNYFTEAFWFHSRLSRTFQGRKPCYFNTGVMVMDLEKWRQLGYTQKVENWMVVQKHKRIYHLGSLPPFLLVLAGRIEAVDHRWNQHGLGGDNIEGKCRGLHPGPISLLHWSGKGKPWLRLDLRKPCNVDYLWAPYDLYRSSKHRFEE